MAENTIDNLSIQVTASADNAARVFDRLASSAGRLRGAASGAADEMRDMADAAKDDATETSKVADQSGRAQPKIRGFGRDAKDAGDNAKKGASGLANFWQSLKRIAYYRFIRSIIKSIGEAFNYGITNLYQWSSAVNGRFASSMDTIKTATNYLKNSFAAMVSPLVNALAPALDFIIDRVVDVINWFNQLFAVLSGASTYTVAKKVASTWADAGKSAAGSAKKAADDIKRTILGFDEINKLVDNKNRGSGTGSGYSQPATAGSILFEEKPITGGFKGFSNAIENALNDTLSRIGLIVSGALLAVGAILTFSGANVPLGLSMMAAGASGLVSIIGINWDGLSADVKLAIGAVEAVVGGSLLAIGGILAFSGTNVPLGIAMMAAGAVSLASAIGLNWDLIRGKVSASAKGVVGAVSAASIALGAILTFTGANVPLGVGLLAAGIVGAAATISWDWLKVKLRGQVAVITSIVSGALLALGAVLAFSGAAIPLGIGMMAAGAVGLATTATANWNTITNKLRGPLGIATALIGGALLVLGAVAVASGHIPLGVGLLVAGSAGLATTIAAKWDRLKDYIKGPIGVITALISGAMLMLGFVAISAGRIPLGLGLMVSGSVGLATTISANWNILQQKLQGPIGIITGILSGATLLLGILALVGGNIPLGLGLILSGAAGLATTIAANWDNLKQLGVDAINKVKEGWESVKNAFKINILPTMDNPFIAHFLGMNTPEEIARQEEEDAGAWKFATEYAKQNNPIINVDFVANGNKAYKNNTLGKWLVDAMEKVKPQAVTTVSSVAGKLTKIVSDKILPDVGSTTTINTVNSVAGDRTVQNSGACHAVVNDTSTSNTVNAVAGYGMSGTNSYSLSAIVSDTDSTNTVHLDEGWYGTPTSALGLDNLYSTAWVDAETPWWYWHKSAIEWLGLGNLQATVRIGATVTGVANAVNSIVRAVVGRANGGVFSNGVWSSLPKYAGGTANAHGSLFVAGEAGPEIVGHVGGRTEVLNKSQIASAMFSAVQAAMAPAAANFAAAAENMGVAETGFDFETLAEMVRQGVEQAMSRANDYDRQKVELLRSINDKDFNVDVSTASINKAQSRMNRRAGVTIAPVGT